MLGLGNLILRSRAQRGVSKDGNNDGVAHRSAGVTPRDRDGPAGLLRVRLGPYQHLYESWHYAAWRRTYFNRAISAAGVTPEIRAAWPRVAG